MRDDALMTQLNRTPLAEQAADLLLERIRDGEWSLGQKIPGETTLGPQLGVGRSTVREAIRHLAGRGVLATRQGSGVYVTALDETAPWDQVVSRADIAAVVEARIAIEVEASVLAAERRTATEMRAMAAAAAERHERRGSVEDHVEADIALHRSIVVAAHNDLLTELFDSLTPRSRRAMTDLLRLRGEYGGDADHQAHLRIVDAISEQDGARAGSSTREHLLALKAHLQ